MLVATAGHIDHGKTALVRALTGVETDRLPEERARGISIDLGFAYWRPDHGKTIGFVDVPGHERFVRNMLAGVCAVDFALLVVAADDGVMPQSVEHVQILDLLGVARGVVAITKCDRCSRERINAVRDQVHALLAPTVLAGLPIFEVSSVTGAGVAELGEALRAADRTEAPRPATGQHFRLAIDRAFTVTGVGTVVTGTVHSGVLETGARLVLSPRGLGTRVRGLQSGGQPVSRIQAGERCALNLAGIERAQVHRGDWLLVSEMHAPTSRIEVRLRVLQSVSKALKHDTPVHLHLGTADVAARVMIPAQAAIPPSGESIVTLVLEHRHCAVTGDRYVLRDQSGRRLIGGGRVIDPFVIGHRHNRAGRAAVSAALQLPDAAQALAALLAIPEHEVDTRQFERCFNLEAGAAQELYRLSHAVLLGSTHTLALPATRVAMIGEQIIEALRAFHRAHPEAGGLTSRALKENLSAQISAEAFLVLQRELADKRLIVSGGSFVRLAGHRASFGPAERALWQTLLPRLEQRGALVFTARELARDLRSSETAIKALLHHRRSHGELWRITDERFMLRKQVAALAASAAVLAQEVGGKGFTAAQYRDAIGAGRNLVIQILEFFDSIAVTRRSGDLRRMRPEYELVVGSAAPYVPREVAVNAKELFGAK
jgi:selenocysteine-specific elongation factor